MPTKQQLESALINADSAGDSVAAKALANAIKLGEYDAVNPTAQLRQATQQTGAADLPEIGMAPELNEMSMGAFKTSLGLLTTGDTDSLKGIFQNNFGKNASFSEDAEGNSLVTFPSGTYALNKPGLSGQDIIRGAFNFAGFTPAGAAMSIPRAIGANALTELAIQGTEQGLGGEDVQPSDVALAGGLGGAFKGAEDLIGAGFRAAKGSPTNEVVEAGAKADIPILTSDVKQPGNFITKNLRQTAEKIPFVGTGKMREAQQAARVDAVDRITEKYSQFSYKSIVDSLKTQKDRVKKAAGNVLNDTGNKLELVGEIPLARTDAAIDSALIQLRKPGVMKSNDALQELDVLMEAMAEVPQTFTTLKENRSIFMDMLRNQGKGEKSQLPGRAKALLEKVSSGMKQDMSSFAMDNLTPAEFAKWNKANTVYASEATKMTKSRLKNVLDKGDVTPETVENMLFSRKPSEVRTVYNSLTNTGKANARAAVVSKAVDNLSRRASGITPNSFSSELKKMGVQSDILFKGAEKRELNGLLKALDATRRAQDAAVTTPTGQSLFAMLLGGGAVIDPVSTAAVGLSAGTLAKSLESSPVRNALLRLDSLPRGSTQFERVLREISSVSLPAAQTARTQIGEQKP